MFSKNAQRATKQKKKVREGQMEANRQRAVKNAKESVSAWSKRDE